MTYIYPYPTPEIPGHHDWAKPWYPSVNSGTTITLGNLEMFTYQIRKVENGFLLKVESKEYVFETIQNLTTYLASLLEPEVK